jgi:hypothetical protein
MLNYRDELFWIEGWECQRNPEYVVEATAKDEGGIKHLIWRCSKATHTPSSLLVQVKSDVLSRGYFSKRPYVLAQACDGSIGSCVLSLYAHFCQSNGIDAIALYREVYQAHDGNQYFDPDLKLAKVIADWEGVSYPPQWDSRAFQGLLESLTEINNHQLVAVLEDKYPQPSPSASNRTRNLALP